jgi:hypothetical protein
MNQRKIARIMLNLEGRSLKQCFFQARMMKDKISAMSVCELHAFDSRMLQDEGARKYCICQEM